MGAGSREKNTFSLWSLLVINRMEFLSEKVFFFFFLSHVICLQLHISKHLPNSLHLTTLLKWWSLSKHVHAFWKLKLYSYYLVIFSTETSPHAGPVVIVMSSVDSLSTGAAKSLPVLCLCQLLLLILLPSSYSEKRVTSHEQYVLFLQIDRAVL